MKSGEWTLRSRRVVTPSGTLAADVMIRGETIAAIGPYESLESEGVILDVGDLAIMPGAIALHRDGWMGAQRLGFGAVSREAGAGGVTTLIDLPSTAIPESGEGPAIQSRMSAADGKIRVDYGLVLALGRSDEDQVEAWIEEGIVGIETNLGPSAADLARPPTEADLRLVMTILAHRERPLLVHSERTQRSSASTSTGRGVDSPGENESEAIGLLIRLCRETRCQVYLIHPPSTEIMPRLDEARAEGLPISIQVSPHHLCLDVEEMAEVVTALPQEFRRYGGHARDRLWSGLRSGLVDAVGAGSSQVFGPMRDRPAGEDGSASRDDCTLRLAMSLVWTEARSRGFELGDLACWMAGRPAELFGFSNRKGSIFVGLDADFVVFDPEGSVLAPPGACHPDSVGDRRTLTGKVEASFLRGRMIYQGGRFFEEPRGTILLRLEDTQPIPESAT